MAKLPTVAIIGRPNTGKSTLFNRLVGKRRAIVSDVPGTTRDHVAYRLETPDMDYLLLDTGGIGGGSEDTQFEDDVSAQSQVALEAADLIIFTIDSKNELTSGDFEVVDILRRKKKRHVPVILAVTKCDNFNDAEEKLHQYYGLGIAEDVVAVSSIHRIGVDELEDLITKHLLKLQFVKDKTEKSGEEPPRVAIIGKPNVGKSSIVNALMSDPQRELSSRIVSDIPGTTRDSSDSIIKHEEKEYIFIDTAGLRRKSRVDEDLEYLGNVKSIQAAEDSDVTIIVLDASEVVAKQDKRIAKLAIDEGKGLIILINKADLLSGEEKKEKEIEVRAALQFCRYVPILFASALTREGLLKMFAIIEKVQQNRYRRIPMKDLIRWYESTTLKFPAMELARSKYITQAEGIPPTFVVFVRNPKNVAVSQLRALDNSMRSMFSFDGVPIRWVTKKAGSID